MEYNFRFMDHYSPQFVMFFPMQHCCDGDFSNNNFTFQMCLYIAYCFIIKSSRFLVAKTALYLIKISPETLTIV